MMTAAGTPRVDFYVLKSSSEKRRWSVACRLAEKAYLRDLRVVLWSDTAAEAQALDEHLWTFSERSFVPHDIVRPGVDVDAATLRAPVQLTPDLDTIGAADLLVNLSGRLPSRLERFSRIAEIVDADAARREQGRVHFKAYRELKLPLETHQLDAAGGPDAADSRIA